MLSVHPYTQPVNAWGSLSDGGTRSQGSRDHGRLRHFPPGL